jgi:hypothetical protein
VYTARNAASIALVNHSSCATRRRIMSQQQKIGIARELLGGLGAGKARRDGSPERSGEAEGAANQRAALSFISVGVLLPVVPG